MSTPLPEPADALAELLARLKAAPREHDFFATLRQVEALCPHWPRLGLAATPAQEALRLGQEPALGHAPAALHALDDRPGQPARLLLHLFGLLGPQGPLPLHITEQAHERQHAHHDPAMARFLDIFNHRMLSLFYRAWAQNQPAVQHDRPGQDRYAAWLGACAGLGAPALPITTDATGTPATGPQAQHAKLAQAGLLANRSRHPEGLCKLLAQQLRLPVRLQQHLPQWLPLAASDCSTLGHAANRPQRHHSANRSLGSTAIAGNRVLSRQHKFRIVLGPMDLATCLGLLPGGSPWTALCETVRHYAGLHQHWDVQLLLHPHQVPLARPDGRMRLGITAWLGRPQPQPGQPGPNLVLRPGAPKVPASYAAPRAAS